MSAQGPTEIQAPYRCADPAAEAWHDQCDVLVVGWGGAGACAALEAREGGADVLVVDRLEGGGASAKSGGVVYAGGGTDQQRAAGQTDSPEAMFDYLRHETQGVVSEATLWRFCQQSRDNLAWLERLGTPYEASMPPGGKTSYPADGYYLYYSGNELVPACRGDNPPAPRGHRTVNKGHGGVVFYRHLRQGCVEAGVRALLQTAVRRLVVEEGSGRVIGVEAWRLDPESPAGRRHRRLARRIERWQDLAPGLGERLRRRLGELERRHAERYLIRARRGVILTTGGFIFNRQMLERHAPRYLRNFRIGTPGCDGSGIRLGESVGGATDHLERVSAWRFINPPLCWPKGIVVNAQGERICNEEVYGATLGHAICEESGGRAWLILDRRLRRQAIRQALTGGYWGFQAIPALLLMFLARPSRSLEALARRIGCDAETLKAQFEAYHRAIDEDAEDPQGKSSSSRQRLDRAPWYACDISVTSPGFPLSAITLGGLRVDEETGAVLDGESRPLAGLFAAGRAAVGVPSHSYISGLSLADCVFSGRRAGQAVLRAADGDVVRPSRQPSVEERG
ncbi:FAD-binding protein [Halomonas sp. H5]|uniref:FAD-binding protein n=1 Tax=Halomonas sp. H5 TaxID=3423910 RepID=UPI003D36CE30